MPHAPQHNLRTKAVILFPSQADAYESEEVLVQEIQAFLHRSARDDQRQRVADRDFEADAPV